MNGGDCFIVAATLQANDPSLVLVHAKVMGQPGGTATPGKYHSHAWVERTMTHELPGWPHPITTTTCIDKANGNDVELPREMYYKLSRAKGIRKYTREQAAIAMMRTQHWGPWRKSKFITHTEEQA